MDEYILKTNTPLDDLVLEVKATPPQAYTSKIDGEIQVKKFCSIKEMTFWPFQEEEEIASYPDGTILIDPSYLLQIEEKLGTYKPGKHERTLKVIFDQYEITLAVFKDKLQVALYYHASINEKEQETISIYSEKINFGIFKEWMDVLSLETNDVARDTKINQFKSIMEKLKL